MELMIYSHVIFVIRSTKTVQYYAYASESSAVGLLEGSERCIYKCCSTTPVPLITSAQDAIQP